MRYPRRRSAAAVVAILTAALLAGGDTDRAVGRRPAAGPAPSIVGAAAAMDTYLSEATRTFRFSGAILVARGTDVVLAKGYGLADISKGTPNSPHTRYRIGSITKQFTALAILKLQELRKLTVTDRVCRYVTRCPAAWRPITIEHLLTHTSGLGNYNELPNLVETTSLSPAALVDTFRDAPLDHPVGSRWWYSNSGYSLLGYVIERVTGAAFADFLGRYILGPLGMSATGYDVNHPDPTHAVGYDPIGQPAPFLDMSIPYAAGAMYSTVTDLYRWNRFLLTGTPPIVSADTRAQMLTRRRLVNTDRPDLYGHYGYGLHFLGDAADATYFHGGGINGFGAYNLVRPHDHLSITVLSNQGVTRADHIADQLAAIADR
jgi:CubicO group peptidase (beta-lactamase class C family)